MILRLVAVGVACVCVAWGTSVRADGGEVVSVGAGGVAVGALPTGHDVVSRNGRWFVFCSDHPGVVPEVGPAGEGQPSQVYLRDRRRGTTRLISRSPTSEMGDGPSDSAVLSANGRQLAFNSRATNLGLTPGATPVGRAYAYDLRSGVLTLLSRNLDGSPASSSAVHSISKDGRFVGFISASPTLVAGDTNQVPDAFVHDRRSGLTERVSTSSGGAQADLSSFSLQLSGSGRYVVFDSAASNLTAAATSGLEVYRKDRKTGQTLRVSVSSSGFLGGDLSGVPSISGDGNLVAFSSFASNLVPGDTNGRVDCFVRDIVAGTTRRVSVASDGTQADGDSVRPSLSGDGRRLSFVSRATTLHPEASTSARRAYIHELGSATTRVVSSGAGASVASATLGRRSRWLCLLGSGLLDGAGSGGADLVLHDLDKGLFESASASGPGVVANGPSRLGGTAPCLSRDGRWSVFVSDATNLVPRDLNGVRDAFLGGVGFRRTQRLSLSSSGAEADGASSGGCLAGRGRFAAFSSVATNLVFADGNGVQDIFVRDIHRGLTERVSLSSTGVAGNGASHSPALSASGRFVAFVSDASNLVQDDGNGVADIFVRDTASGTTRRVSVAGDGSEADAACGGPVLSANGRFVAFHSSATNLVAGDLNGVLDVFLHDRQTGQTKRVSLHSDGTQASSGGHLGSRDPSLSGSGRYVAFRSDASGLVDGPSNGVIQAYLHDIKTGETLLLSHGPTGDFADGDTCAVALAGRGRWAALGSLAGNLGGEADSGAAQVYLVELETDELTRVSAGLAGAQASTTRVHLSRSGGLLMLERPIAPPGAAAGLPGVVSLDR
jgi:Tol biopolymer transport system component